MRIGCSLNFVDGSSASSICQMKIGLRSSPGTVALQPSAISPPDPAPLQAPGRRRASPPLAFSKAPPPAPAPADTMSGSRAASGGGDRVAGMPASRDAAAVVSWHAAEIHSKAKQRPDRFAKQMRHAAPNRVICALALLTGVPLRNRSRERSRRESGNPRRGTSMGQQNGRRRRGQLEPGSALVGTAITPSPATIRTANMKSRGRKLRRDGRCPAFAIVPSSDRSIALAALRGYRE